MRRDATATRLDQPGTVPVSNGLLSDQFAGGNAIHIYRIDGGSNSHRAPAATRVTPARAPTRPGDLCRSLLSADPA